MNRRIFDGALSRILSVMLLLFLLAPMTAAADSDCDGQGDYHFLCGPTNAEDLVRVPGSRWIIASSLSAEGPFYLIDTSRKSWEPLYPETASDALQDTDVFGSCPGKPDPEALVTHGLNLRPVDTGHSTLYVVGHGGREAIEVFDIDASGEKPMLTWKGCVLTPDGMAANSVASLPDGSLLATIPLRTGIPMKDALAGKDTGGVYAWSPGDSGIVPVAGTDMPYANGIEVSPDGAEFYVASSGLFNVTAFSNTNPARVLRRTGNLTFLPDNLHLDSRGNLLTAGLHLDDPICGNLESAGEFDFQAFMTCPRGFTVWSIDPGTMQGSTLAAGPANADFSNITMALPVDGEVWIGTFAGDRIAYRLLER